MSDPTNAAGDSGTTTTAVRVRPLEQGDFFAWYELYSGYADFYETPLQDERAMRAWTWLHSDASAMRGLVAVDADGTVMALAHVREFERLLENDRGLYLEDLFVGPRFRNRGVARAIFDHLKQEARDRGFGVIRWITAEDNYRGRAVYDRVGTKTKWVTYDIPL